LLSKSGKGVLGLFPTPTSPHVCLCFTMFLWVTMHLPQALVRNHLVQ
jgi:hypothetical protein